ncbi:MAG: toll/interleukin-1 receptor domain-containing protein [Candidatus Nanopelagicales bacterium]
MRSSPDSVALLVLQLVGLADEDRRIFLSHRRTDGSVLAEQLRTALADDRWDVFLDRFSVPPAVDFQERLDRELADKAFVLLLETPQASGSDWVEHEVAFALRHRLGLLSLALPETTRAQLFPSVHDSWRHRLAARDFKAGHRSGELTPAALDRVLVDIELGHAKATRLRRESVMSDAEAELLSLGYSVQPVSEWALLGTRDGVQDLVVAIPRAPVPADLREAEMQRRLHRRSGMSTRAWLVHPTEDVDTRRVSLLLWLTARRKVVPTPLMLLRSRLSA